MSAAKLRAAAIAALAVVGALAAWQWRAVAPSAGAPPETAIGAPARTKLVWPGGEQRVYALTWKSETHTPIAGQGQQGFDLGSDLDADLVVRSLGEKNGAFDLVVGLADVRRLEMRVQGKASGADERAGVAGHEALVRVDETGAVKAISFRATTPTKLRRMLINVIGALRVTLPDAPSLTWSALEPTPIGTASVVYTVSPDRAGLLQRRRVEYTRLEALGSLVGEAQDQHQELEASGTVQLDASGAIAEVREEETFALKTPEDAIVFSSWSRMAIVPKGTTKFNPADVDVASLDQKVDDGRVAVDPRQGDQQFGSEITEERIVAGIVGYGGGGKLPRGFMTRTGAFLRLHPEKERDLLAFFSAPGTTPRARELLADVWSVAGDAAAQQALREALSWGADHVPPEEQSQCLQRFTFVARPELASASFVTASYTSARDQDRALVRGASAVALGAIAKRLARGGADEQKVAAATRALFTADLARARSADEKSALLEALGNAAVADDAAVVARYVGDPAEGVRESGALALRHMDSPDARRTLLVLVRDPAPRVARTALRALRTQDLSDAQWAELEAMAAAGTTNTAVDSTLVELVRVQEAGAGAHAAPILRAVLARTSESEIDLRTTIRGILDDPTAG